MKTHHCHFGLSLLAAVATCWLAAPAEAQGLSALNPKNALRIFKKKETPPVTPKQIVSLWSDTVLQQAGKQPTRGLGGRIYFYDAKHRPVKVAGTLVVYGFDDRNGTPDNRPADRKYVFKPEHLPGHFSVSDFGPSYSVWLPWDAVGGEQKKLSLVAVFRDQSGELLVGQMSRCVLPGPSSSETVGAKIEALRAKSSPQQLEARLTGVRPVSYEEPQTQLRPSSSQQGGNRGGTEISSSPLLRSTTITLPPSTRRRLAAPVVPQAPRERIIPGRAQIQTSLSRPWQNSQAAETAEPFPAREFAGQPGQAIQQASQHINAAAAGPAWRQPAEAIQNPAAEAAAAPPPTHFVRPRYRAQATPVVLPERDLRPTQHRPAAPLYDQ